MVAFLHGSGLENGFPKNFAVFKTTNFFSNQTIFGETNNGNEWKDYPTIISRHQQDHYQHELDLRLNEKHQTYSTKMEESAIIDEWNNKDGIYIWKQQHNTIRSIRFVWRHKNSESNVSRHLPTLKRSRQWLWRWKTRNLNWKIEARQEDKQCKMQTIQDD